MAKYKWLVLVVWLIGAIAVSLTAGHLDGKTRDSFTVPGTDSQAAVDLLSQRFPSQNFPTATVLFASSKPITASAEAIDTSLAEIKKLPHVSAVSNPFGQFPTISPNGRVASVTVTYNLPSSQLTEQENTYDKLVAATKPASQDGLTVKFGGTVTDIFNQKVGGASAHADEIGLAFAVIILLLAFGSVIAMGLPLGTALCGLGVATSLIYIVATRYTVGTVVPYIGAMIGLGVGIDYSLFIVTRFRQNLASGMNVPDAVANAIGTAGSAVLFAGTTVCIATCGLSIMQIPYVTTMGLMSALVVAVMVSAALTLLPALLATIGTHIDSLRVPKVFGRKKAADSEGAIWARWAQIVASRPWYFGIATFVLLLVLAVPVLHMQLGFTNDGNEPQSSPQRQAYDLTTEAFGQGANGPLLIAASLPTKFSASTTTQPSPAQLAEANALKNLILAIQKTPGITSVTPPDPSPQLNAVVFLATPKTGPSAPETTHLVRELRNNVIPKALHGTALSTKNVHVGGQTAELIDLSDRISDRLPLFIAAVVGAAFLLLLLVFHSVVISLTAGIMNLLSIGGAYGIVVAMFQWGWGKSFIGLKETVPVVPVVPVMMFAILFGLSMDYEVFLLSRIREEYVKHNDPRASVVNGLALTARVITSAALIMIAVFLSFVSNPQPIVKMMGVGLSVAVFLDATLVRMMLVPAVMEILGRANWYMPKWLDRVLPKIELDG